MNTKDIEKELNKYKDPTQLNGTDYFHVPVNKLKHIITKVLEDERERQYDILMSCLPSDAENLSTLTPNQAKTLIECFSVKTLISEV